MLRKSVSVYLLGRISPIFGAWNQFVRLTPLLKGGESWADNAARPAMEKSATKMADLAAEAAGLLEELESFMLVV